MPLDFQPREVRCPVTGFRWMARTRAEARLRWSWIGVLVLYLAVGFFAGVVWERIA